MNGVNVFIDIKRFQGGRIFFEASQLWIFSSIVLCYFSEELLLRWFLKALIYGY